MALLATPFTSAPSPRGDPGFFLVLIISPIQQFIRFSQALELKVPSLQIPALLLPCYMTSGNGFSSLSSGLGSVKRGR